MLVGRAIGRVLSHELFHIFARSQSHGTRDVDKPFYSAEDLTADRFGWEPKSAILRLGGPVPQRQSHREPASDRHRPDSMYTTTAGVQPAIESVAKVRETGRLCAMTMLWPIRSCS